VVSRIGLGLAAVGRPACITSGREQDLPDRSVAGLRARTFSMLDAAYAAGVRYADAARSYGRAEEFLAGRLAERGQADVIAGSKWGYRYTGGWRLDAARQEVKDHSLAMFTAQLAQSRALLGDRLTAGAADRAGRGARCHRRRDHAGRRARPAVGIGCAVRRRHPRAAG
jgi:aryl-alcohol dehydrogenase-like predicted oxidoreductase